MCGVSVVDARVDAPPRREALPRFVAVDQALVGPPVQAVAAPVTVGE